MEPSLILRAREALAEATPLRTDCGAVCGAACCQADEDGRGGMYLFPGEERAPLPRGGEILQDPRGFAPIFVCAGACEREKRPLACRIFPLTPAQSERGWGVRMDARARSMCPLTRWGVRGLNPGFVRAVRAAVRMLAQDERIEAYLRRWEEIEREYATLW